MKLINPAQPLATIGPLSEEEEIWGFLSFFHHLCKHWLASSNLIFLHSPHSYGCVRLLICRYKWHISKQKNRTLTIINYCNIFRSATFIPESSSATFRISHIRVRTYSQPFSQPRFYSISLVNVPPYSVWPKTVLRDMEFFPSCHVHL